MRKFNSIIFDFDLTLADSSDAIVTCMNYAFRKMNIPQAEPEIIKKTIGISLPETFRLLTNIDDPDRTLEFRKFFREKSNQIMVDMTEVFENVPVVLKQLKTMGFRLAIVSTKYRHRIEDVLRRDGLLDYFELIVGGEDVENHKPDPEGLLVALQRLAENKTNVVYVGDSLIDAQSAQSAGLDFIAVLSGNTSAVDFNGHRPLKIIRNLDELPLILPS